MINQGTDESKYRDGRGVVTRRRQSNLLLPTNGTSEKRVWKK